MSMTPDDRLEILGLYAAYALDFDGGHAERCAAWFTPDGVFQYEGSRRFQGTDELVALFRRRHAAAPGIRHFVSNIVLTPTDQGVLGRAYVLVLRIGDDAGLRVVTAGQYTDDLVRTDAGWRLAARTFTAWLPEQLIDAPLLLSGAR